MGDSDEVIYKCRNICMRASLFLSCHTFVVYMCQYLISPSYERLDVLISMVKFLYIISVKTAHNNIQLTILTTVKHSRSNIEI